MSAGRRNIFTANRSGVPIFAPGWNAASVGSRYRSRFILRVTGVLLLAGASIGAIGAGVGADNDYLDRAATGTMTTGSVINALSRTTQTAPTTGLDTGAVEQTYTIQYSLDEKTYQQEVPVPESDELSALEPDGEVNVLAGPTAQDPLMLVTGKEAGAANFLSLSPLLGALVFMIAASSSLIGWRKMARISQYLTPKPS